ncbi:MAG: alpha-galactosidase [Calditrichaeota bacterium]|nr:alpha-galactosidase [Calditrichota bacterium]HQU74318.1 alpha-galactosidase [Calditrichia bacterium]
MLKKNILTVLLLGIAVIWLSACGSSGGKTIGDGAIQITFDENLRSRIAVGFDGKTVALGAPQVSEVIEIDGRSIVDFPLSQSSQSTFQDAVGTGTEIRLSGEAGGLRKTVQVRLYQRFPGMAVYRVSYRNLGEAPLKVTGWANNQYRIEGQAGAGEPAFWAYQGASYTTRPDWVMPLKEGFQQRNFMGMNYTDYGSGTPVVDIWRRDVGVAVGHLELVPRILSLPVSVSDGKASLGVSWEGERTLAPGQEFQTYDTFVAVHQGDHFATLSTYREMMVARGIKLADYPESTYEPIWCAWGYERDFTTRQVVNTLPKVSGMGYKWAVLDDGYHNAEGDWYLLKDKFPRGDKSMKQFTDDIRARGLRPKLWWAPMAVDPGTDLIKNHPDYLLINKDGNYQKIEWWDAYYLCPAYAPVQGYTRDLVKKFMTTWGYDGLKIDGQHLNGAPPCYNEAHNHAYPEESFEKTPELFKVIYQTALSIVPDAVVEICPCGATYGFHQVPYMNQPVASDPTSSFQVRLKGKTLKALMGPTAPYYGDHVELSDHHNDFASSVGIGGVIGTKFTWPVGAKADSKLDLTPEREKVWQHWLDIYTEKMLPKGQYRGDLYDIGFDRPEGHAIAKNGGMYYAFYGDGFEGQVELRGLQPGQYTVRDYVNDRDYGTVEGPTAALAASFDGSLLLEVLPRP